jgi:hypothetical protein
MVAEPIGRPNPGAQLPGGGAEEASRLCCPVLIIAPDLLRLLLRRLWWQSILGAPSPGESEASTALHADHEQHQWSRLMLRLWLMRSGLCSPVASPTLAHPCLGSQRQAPHCMQALHMLETRHRFGTQVSPMCCICAMMPES